MLIVKKKIDLLPFSPADEPVAMTMIPGIGSTRIFNPRSMLGTCWASLTAISLF